MMRGMEPLNDFYRSSLRDLGSRRFQNEVAQDVYECLANSMADRANEVTIVTKLTEVMNNQSYGPFHFYSEKIHGSRSNVEFNFRHKAIKKELADMVVISVVSLGRERVHEKISFIQNKVGSKESWKIDNEQLFLLKNFPTFHGKKGIFKTSTDNDIVFINHSRCLGAYGLFFPPGEMLFISAYLLSQLCKKATVKNATVSVEQLIEAVSDTEFYYLSQWHRYSDATGHPWSPVAGNSYMSRDIHEFIRNWTHFNIGEPTIETGSIVNSALADFSTILLRRVGMAEYLDLGDTGDDAVAQFNFNLAVFVMHIDLAQHKPLRGS